MPHRPTDRIRAVTGVVHTLCGFAIPLSIPLELVASVVASSE